MAKKKKNSSLDKVGIYAFIAGLIIALGVTLASPTVLHAQWAATLAVLGLIVGLLNINEKETSAYLGATTAFIIAAWGLLSTIGTVAYVTTFLHAVIVFATPGAIVVSLKALFLLAKN